MSPSTPGGEGNQMNLVLVRTASSIEILAVEVYNVALGESDTKLPTEIQFDPAVADAAKLFRDHHQEHADALAQATESIGGEPYEKPNKFLFDNVVAKELPNLTDQAKVVMFARTLEETAAGTYAFAASELTTPALGQSIMSIGGVESRHAAALSLTLDGTGTDAVPRSFIDASPEGRVPDEALIQE
ncbi:MAG: ferritin-like domain-containing protein [Solirubrobacterales bacterium]|nr:ferritin-like domain-containing protein [Solirubrobacterales bacterium]